MLKRKKDKRTTLIPVKYQTINSLVNRLWIFGDKSPTVGKPNSKFDVKYATCVRSPKNVYT